MITKKLIITNKFGLHARAAAKFVTEAGRYTSDIHVAHNGKQVNGKSIMGLMTLAASKGTEIELSVNGEDEAAAFNALETLISNGFGEE